MWTPSPSPSRISAAIALLALASSVPAYAAGTLAVSPVRVELSRRQTTAVVTLDNQGDSERSYQIEPMLWSQSEGEDRYEETRDLIVVPPMVKLGPGQKQVVRVGIRRQPAQQELAFRIFVQELPIRSSQDHPAVQTLLRVGIPVFLAPSSPIGAPELDCQAELGSEGLDSLILHNPTGIHVQVGRVHFANGEVIGAAFYLLPGQKKRWMLPRPVPTQERRLDLRLDTDYGPMDVAALVR
jgi:fimbrial chaperone protein